MAESKQVAVKDKKSRVSLVEKFAGRFGVDAVNVMPVLRATAFSTGKGNPPATNEEVAALMIVADQYNLNPFTKEIYAFRNKSGGITPIVGYDGWVRLVQAQPAFRGEVFESGEDETRGFYYECTMYRQDRQVPTKVREYLKENQRNTDPWRDMPNRMLRMRAYIQCARICFGFGGIYEQSEGEAIALGSGVDYISAAGEPAHSKQPASAKTAEEPFATDEQVAEIVERLGKTGLADNLVLAKFEVGAFPELRYGQVMDVLKFISDNAP